MRKIKITALVLAVLMVVTAFAGCASKSAVTNLDDKVNDLDGKIKDQSEALAGITSTLADIQNALKNQTPSGDLDDIKKDVEENKKSFEDIQKALEALTKQLEDLKGKTDAVTGDNEDVKKAISQAGAKIDALKGAFEDAKKNYTTEDIAAIRAIFGDAQASISACTTVAAVNAALDAMNKALDAHKAVNAKLYDYVVALENNITDDSKDKVAEAVDALTDAITFYGSAAATELTAYKVSDDETVNLVDAINALNTKQTVDLANIKAQAAELVKKINDIDATYTFAQVNAINTEYKVWKKAATKLSPKNEALVTNADKIEKALASALNADTAKTVFGAETLTSKITGNEEGIFFDYDQLLASNEQTVFYKVLSATSVLATKDVYAAIDAKIAAWAKEYELTDAAVEYIIDTAKGANYYAKYKADKALCAAFEAEYAKVNAKDGIFAAIKSLGTKKLGADAVDVINAFKKNANDINAWRDALVKAYEAELKADEDAFETRNIYNVTKYTEVLEKNFVAMTIKAQLCEYDPVTKTYATYDEGFLADITNDATGNAYYFKLYNFTDANLVNFIKVVFPQAQASADAINKKIENFKPAQALSVKDILVGIGGYVKVDGVKLVANTTDEIVAALALNGTPKTIAQFVYAYKTSVNYDLTNMIKVADYEAKIVEVEKLIKNADAAAANLNDAYSALVGELDASNVIITTKNAAAAQNVYKLLSAWLKVGNADMQVATLTNTTAAGVKEYKLANIFDNYEKIAPDTVRDPASTGTIVTLKNKADKILAEEALVVSIYQMMDKVYAWDNANAFGFDNHQNNGVAKNTYNLARKKFNTQGVVNVTISDSPMTADGKDSSGKTYKKDMYLWTIEYVTFSNNKFTTAKLNDYFYTNNKNNAETAVNADGAKIEALLGAKLWKPAVVKVDNNSEYVDTITNQIPALVKAGSIFNSFSNVGLSNKAIPNFALPILAMSFDAKFAIDNLGTTDKVTAAKKAWDPENGGYGFNYIKAITKAVLTEEGVSFTGPLNDAYKAATDMDQLKVVVNSLISASGVTLIAPIAYGRANYAWMTSNFDISAADFAAQGYDTADFKVDGIVIYFVCDHSSTPVTCVGEEAACPDCGVMIPGSAAHVMPAGTPACTDYNCERCGKLITANHTYNTTSIAITDAGLMTSGSVSLVKVNLTCSTCGDVDAVDVTTGIAFNDADSSATFTVGDTVSFQLTVGGVVYDVVGTYTDAGVWNTVATVAA